MAARPCVMAAQLHAWSTSVHHLNRWRRTVALACLDSRHHKHTPLNWPEQYQMQATSGYQELGGRQLHHGTAARTAAMTARAPPRPAHSHLCRPVGGGRRSSCANMTPELPAHTSVPVTLQLRQPAAPAGGDWGLGLHSVSVAAPMPVGKARCNVSEVWYATSCYFLPPAFVKPPFWAALAFMSFIAASSAFFLAWNACDTAEPSQTVNAKTSAVWDIYGLQRLCFVCDHCRREPPHCSMNSNPAHTSELR